MTDSELIKLAFKGREASYCPYSNYAVGAALLTASGKVYIGCNIENAAFTPGNCAERTAFFKAVSEGERHFSKIAIVGGPVGKAVTDYAFPCGVCRQVMQEFCNPETFEIVTGIDENTFKKMTLKEMLPCGFGPDNLN